MIDFGKKIMIKSFYFQGHYNSWWRCRREVLIKLLVSEFFKGKTVLDIGSGNGTFANTLHELGAIVTCSEGRLEHIECLKSKYPHLVTRCRHDNYEQNISIPFHDVICHFGTLHHVQNFEQHFKSLEGKSKYIFLDCEVLDSDRIDLKAEVNDAGYDQSLSGTSHYTTAEYIENMLVNCKMKFMRIVDKSLNTSMHKYNWQVSNTEKHIPGQHRFWICTQDGYDLQDCLKNAQYYSCATFVKNTFPESILNFVSSHLTHGGLLEIAMKHKQPRISIYVDEARLQHVQDRLQENNYIIYDVYKSHIERKHYQVMAVLPHIAASEEFSFIIQGLPGNVNTDITRNICFSFGRPIDATWDPIELAHVRGEVLKKRIYNKQNIYFQTESTLKGSSKATTKYVVKLRSDEYYSNFTKFLQVMKQYPDKIISNNVFARRTRDYPFHISDHVLGGTKSNIEFMFNEAKEALLHGKGNGRCAEQHLVMSYMKGKDVLLANNSDEIKKQMKMFFDIVSIKEMGEYYIVANSVHNFVLTQSNTETNYGKFVDIESIDEM